MEGAGGGGRAARGMPRNNDLPGDQAVRVSIRLQGSHLHPVHQQRLQEEATDLFPARFEKALCRFYAVLFMIICVFSRVFFERQ